MKKTANIFIVAFYVLIILSGCGQTNLTSSVPASDPTPETSKTAAIPFTGDQLYAVALVGCQDLSELSSYLDQYTDTNSDSIPTFVISEWEYYLIIPRYPDMNLALYQNDMETSTSKLMFQQGHCEPFLIQCNISDIFADATISFTYHDETVSFSPYVSLRDGSLQIGARGLNLTK